ncbi:MAG TPA: pilus assembly protein TadG-related protein [Acidobacteriaceae bacterium]|nr:pilus assembly protein TadG-related protein [Acidobacteriaceae bacterium]
MKGIFASRKTGFRNESGQTLVLVVASMVAVMGFVGLAIDVGNLRADERKLQQTADSAALAGALELNYCTYSAGTACTMMTNAATSSVKENGFSAPTLKTDTCTTPSISGVTLVVNWGPCLLGSATADPNYGSSKVVEAQVGQKYGTYFASVLGLSTVTLTARAEAGRGNSGYCVFVDTKDYGTNPGSGNLDIESGGQITLGCGIQDDGTLTSKNGSHLTATQFEVSSSTGTGSNQFYPAPSFNAPQVQDPVCATYTYETSYNHTSSCGTMTFASPAPSAGGSSATTAPTGCTVLTGSVAVGSLTPGCYSAASTNCSTGKTKTSNGVCDAVTLSGAGTLASGTYIFNGNFNVGNYDVTSGASGTTLYFMNGSITNAGGSNLTLNAPTSGSMAGMLIWVDPKDTATFPLASGSKSVWNGIIFDEYGTVDLGDGSIASSGCSGNYTILDAGNITATHGGKLNINICTDYSALGGNPIQGYTAVLSE